MDQVPVRNPVQVEDAGQEEGDVLKGVLEGNAIRVINLEHLDPRLIVPRVIPVEYIIPNGPSQHQQNKILHQEDPH